ncbi:HTH-type transcriptional repressor NsrR [compost metagenome]
MRLTALTDYSLRVLMFAGVHQDRLCTLSEIAQSYAISHSHLMKVSQLLAQNGWITTARGKNGGLRLSKRPSEISLGQVIRSIEPDFALVECLGANNQCQLNGSCTLTSILQGALRAFWQHLDCYTLADAISNGSWTNLAPLQPARCAEAHTADRLHLQLPQLTEQKMSVGTRIPIHPDRSLQQQEAEDIA